MAESIVKFKNAEDLEVVITFDDIKKYICPLATEKEIMIFLQVCKMRRLNPFTGEVYLIKYASSQAAGTVINYHTFLQRAKRNPNYRGFKSGIIVINQEKKVERREGAFYLPSETLLGGWCKVKMEGFEVPSVEISIVEYQQYKGDGQLNRFWKKMAGTMIKKTAEGQAHRLANPEDLEGLLLREEVQGDEEATEAEKEKKSLEKKGEWKEIPPGGQEVKPKKDLEVDLDVKDGAEQEAPEKTDEQPPPEQTTGEMWGSLREEEGREESLLEPPSAKKKKKATLEDLPEIIKIHSLREKAGIERADFFFNLTAALGREIKSTKDLSEEEKKETIKELVGVVNKKIKKGGSK